MPSTITHEYFYRDVYNHSSNNFKKMYSKDFYNSYSVSGQGHDALFFHNFWNIPDFYIRKKIILNLENNNFRKLCVDYIEQIFKNELQFSKDTKLILYGYILHHILDSYAHPYINYETTIENLHEEVESYLDQWMIKKREKSNPYKYPVHKIIPSLPSVSKETIKVISNSFESVYDLENFGKIYINSLKQVKLFLRLFRYDFTGIKKLGYNIIDTTHLFNLTFSWLSYRTKYIDFQKYLNEEHREWGNPIDEKIISTESFIDLYCDALEEGSKIISNLEEAIVNNATTQEIREIIPNKSAVHGLECGRSMTFNNLRR